MIDFGGQEFSTPNHLSAGVLTTMGGAQCLLNRTVWVFTSASAEARNNLGLRPGAPTPPLNATIQAVFGARDTWPQRLLQAHPHGVAMGYAQNRCVSPLPQAHLEG